MTTFLTRATPLNYSEQHSSGVGDTLGGGLTWISQEKKASMVESLEKTNTAPAHCWWKRVKPHLQSGAMGQDLMPFSVIVRETSVVETKRLLYHHHKHRIQHFVHLFLVPAARS